MTMWRTYNVNLQESTVCVPLYFWWAVWLGQMGSEQEKVNEPQPGQKEESHVEHLL
jgi:hypothetical protein